MTTAHIAVREEEFDKVISYIDRNACNCKMAKLLIDVATRNYGSVLTKETCSKIYNLYLELYQKDPNLNVQINIESLKGRAPERNSVDSVIELSDCSLDKQTLLSPLAKGKLDTFKNVVLGGTFDRLHVGHKILLTEAVARCNSKLTVGVTDENMIQGKKLWELIEPLEKRMESVMEFLEAIDGGLVYEVEPISDMFGPTITDPNLHLIVVTTETQKGGLKVNEVRKSKTFPPLAMHVAALVESDNLKEGEEKKISSSNQRLRLLGSRLHNVEFHRKPGPYLIGLTGGIASGKSSIGRRLEAAGAGLVNCDVIAHKLYRKGTATYHAIIELFGTNVVGSDGEIDRKRLGDIVFSSESEMAKLNDLMWPLILNASLDEAKRLYNQNGKHVVVLEAAVLLRAHWQTSVDEVWTSIISPEEAKKRIMNRNGLTESDAQARIDSQPSNSEYVAIANVVFSTLLSEEFTQSQVDKAWKELQTYLIKNAAIVA